MLGLGRHSKGEVPEGDCMNLTPREHRAGRELPMGDPTGTRGKGLSVLVRGQAASSQADFVSTTFHSSHQEGTPLSPNWLD